MRLEERIIINYLEDTYPRLLSAIRKLSRVTEEGLQKLDEVHATIEGASRNISAMFKMIDIIDEISSNINILAINASIESARAGEYGAGFQVIAQEIQELSDSTAKNAKDISDLLSNVVQSIQNSMAASSDNDTLFEQVKKQVENVTAILSNIIGKMGDLSDTSNEILT